MWSPMISGTKNVLCRRVVREGTLEEDSERMGGAVGNKGGNSKKYLDEDS